MKITERILQVIDIKGITKYKFCKDLGVSSAFLDKPRDITTDKYANVLAYFPDINPEWLLTGIGDMLRTQENASVVNTATSGGINANINGSKNTTVGEPSSELLEIIKEQSKQINEKDRQIEKLLNLLGK